ncbi:MAG: dihydrodipicolinate synthase family protein [bacterium]|nr:dihydrodipicolinate synthase family protein [bacterium]
MSDPIRGILPVLQTPLNEDGTFDAESMKRQVDFCVAAGAGGLVYPVLGGEFQYLSDRERQHWVEVVVVATDGRVPVIVGVAGTNTSVAVELAAHAKGVGADAVIGMPPYLARGGQDEVRAYYEAISDAGGLPIFVQNAGVGMAPAALVRLLKEVEQVTYIKEEASPSAHHISEIVREAGEHCRGVFGGAWCRWMISEMRRGASGFMPGATVVDVHVDIWNAFQDGDEARAREWFNQLLPLTNLTQILGLPLVKEVLVRRGMFQTAGMRMPGTVKMDDEDYRELGAVLTDLEPLFRTQVRESVG